MSEKHAVLLRAYSPLGFYPADALRHSDASFVLNDDMIFSAVRYVEIDIENYHPEREWLSAAEVRLLASIVLSVPFEFGKVYGPAIITFLDYVPLRAPKTLPGQLLAYRMIRGMSQRQAAREVGVDPSTWERWENNTATPRLKRPNAIISSFILPVVEGCAYHE